MVTEPATDKPVSTESPGKAHWLEGRAVKIFAIVAALQILAFLTFVDREIIWTYAFNFDQATYLLRAYEDYEVLLTQGIQAAVVSGLTAPVAGGGLLSLEAALVFSIFGLSRKVALGLHLAHWLVCQGFVFLAGRKIGNSAGWGLAGVGVLLALPAPMVLVGGMFDFRFDLPAMALIGILSALVVLSDGFANRKWAIWFGIVAIYSIWIRHILLVYLAGGMGLYACALLAFAGAMKKQPTILDRLRNVCIAGGMTGAAIVVLIVIKFDVLYNYYYVGHFAGAEKEVRAAVYGATGLTRYTYYLQSVIHDQMGALALGLLGIYFGWHALSRILAPSPESKSAWQKRGEIHTLIFLTALVAATYVVLSFDISKSPIVGNVFCVPVVLIVLLAARMVSRPIDPAVYHRYAAVSGTLALLILAAGSVTAFARYSRHSPIWGQKDEIQQVVQAQLQIGDYARKMSQSRSVLFVDRNTDYQNAVSIMVSNYERTGRMITLEDPVGGNVMLSDWKALRVHLMRADVALVTEERMPGEDRAPYPTTRMFSEHLAEINRLTNAQMTRAGGFQIGPHRVGLFLRPQIVMKGDSAGWLTGKGVLLRLHAEWLKGKSGIALSGRTLNPNEVRGRLGFTAMVKSTGQALPVYFSPVTPEYRIEIDTTRLEAGETGEIEIEVKFDRNWLQQTALASPEDRELAVGTPSSVVLLTEPQLHWGVNAMKDKKAARR